MAPTQLLAAVPHLSAFYQRTFFGSNFNSVLQASERWMQKCITVVFQAALILDMRPDVDIMWAESHCRGYDMALSAFLEVGGS